jgi:hypothetical protein
MRGWLVLPAIFVFGLVSVVATGIQQQPDELQTQKLKLEIAALQRQAAEREQRERLELQKLEREIATLERQPPTWLSPVLTAATTVLSVVGGLLAGFLGAKKAATSAFNVARSNREGELDQSVHQHRLELYPRLVKATAPLAIYFPDYAGALAPYRCAEMGREMSQWYFAGGGLLLSNEARDAYFAIVRALTRASKAVRLQAPHFPDDAANLSVTTLRDFRQKLPIAKDGHSVENWQFGSEVADTAPPEEKFRDYVFLQHLGSSLRTELASDIRGRRRPGDAAQ